MMKKTCYLLVLLWGLLLPVMAQTPAYRVEDVPMVHLPKPDEVCQHPDGILSPATVAALDTTLFASELARPVLQTLVVAVKARLKGDDCFGVRLRTGTEKRKVGAKRKRQRSGHLARNGRTLHPVCYGIRTRRRPAGCSLQADSGALHEPGLLAWRLGQRYAGRRTGRQTTVGRYRQSAFRSGRGRRQSVAALDSRRMFYCGPAAALAQCPPAQQMPELPPSHLTAVVGPHRIEYQRHPYGRNRLPLQPVRPYAPPAAPGK